MTITNLPILQSLQSTYSLAVVLFCMSDTPKVTSWTENHTELPSPGFCIDIISFPFSTSTRCFWARENRDISVEVGIFCIGDVRTRYMIYAYLKYKVMSCVCLCWWQFCQASYLATYENFIITRNQSKPPQKNSGPQDLWRGNAGGHFSLTHSNVTYTYISSSVYYLHKLASHPLFLHCLKYGVSRRPMTAVHRDIFLSPPSR